MRIDWEAPSDVPEQTKRLANELRPAGARSRFEAIEATSMSSAERLERLAGSIACGGSGPEAEKPDPEIAHEIMRGAASALAKLDDPDARYTFRERAGLEAVILTDGTRPSLTVKSGFVDLQNPEIGNWDGLFQTFDEAMKGVIAAVGRVNVPTNVGFVGTCFAIAPDLVLTNRHVLEEIAHQEGSTWTLRHPETTTIDFVGEADATTHTSNKVLSVVFAGADPINRQVNFAHLDVAILKLDPGPGLPAAVTLEADSAVLRAGRALYLVGFPARPRTHYGEGAPPPGYETSEVMASVFKRSFGIKKLAPGRVDAASGNLVDDVKGWVFSHDASTLGGNSGSAVVDLTIDGARVVGLHFGGLARKENWAHTIARINELRQLDALKWV